MDHITSIQFDVVLNYSKPEKKKKEKKKERKKEETDPYS